MQERNILVRFLAVPRRQKFVAAVIAIAIGGGFFAWSRRAAVPETPAVLSFDKRAAGQADPDVTHAKEPAIALAQSILSNEVARGLAKHAGVTFPGKEDDAAEFRSRLVLGQPSEKLLHISYRDADRKLSVAVANAVANLLAAWKPLPVVAVAVSTPAPETQVVPVSTASAVKPRRQRRPQHSRPDLLGDLEAQLALTDQKLAALDAASQANARRKAEAVARLSSADSEQRRILESQLSMAQKKLDDLRVRYTDEYPDVETAKENVAEIQQKLASLRPVNNDPEQVISSQKPDSYANEVVQLRQERARLTQTIAVEKRRGALRHDQAGSEPEDSPEVAQTVSPSLPPQTPVPQSANPGAGPTVQNPFTLVELAGAGGASHTELSSLSLGALAGMLCALLYLSGAMWWYRRMESEAAPEYLVSLDEFRPHEVTKDADVSIDAGTIFENLFRGKAQDIVFEESLESQVQESAPGKSWESEVREAIALTAIGCEEEALAARDHSLDMDRRQIYGGGSGLQGLLRYDEVSEAIREKIKRDPNSWMAHTEKARVALSAGDWETAVAEIKLAVAVAPEKLRPKIEKIVGQLDKTVGANR
jgi:tetratricopeptide (TPR) repeat protein